MDRARHLSDYTFVLVHFQQRISRFLLLFYLRRRYVAFPRPFMYGILLPLHFGLLLHVVLSSFAFNLDSKLSVLFYFLAVLFWLGHCPLDSSSSSTMGIPPQHYSRGKCRNQSRDTSKPSPQRFRPWSLVFPSSPHILLSVTGDNMVSPSTSLAGFSFVSPHFWD